MICWEAAIVNLAGGGYGFQGMKSTRYLGIIQ